MSRHIPVLLKEVIDSLQLKSNDNVIDCTLGDAGHAEAILNVTAPNGKLLGIDTDAEALLRAKRFLYGFGERAIYSRGNFVDLGKIARENKFGQAQGILMDLGWSSPQFEERGRGFSFANDEPLDMRYAPEWQTAAELINDSSEKELAKIFKQYGEEKLSAEIAAALAEAKKTAPIETTKQLVEIILQVYRKKLHSEREVPWVGGLHPATKVFQALRIAVNNELEAIGQALPQAVALLAQGLPAGRHGGRLAVITFHSLEDRVVKQYFKSIENKQIKIITPKPLGASDAEAEQNPRARSAKLRVIERI
ncbi:16S rRNA (cytosine(1402)-N(4))-methyltransferase RsmH [Patescibacteria group bacterium]|nr:MAG: 16S rRNA (cytosine(1402)-N(4))-methyltransferase RsmH [Patescibacteria group bacterium]